MQPQLSASHSQNIPSSEHIINSTEPILFDWQNRWLKGHQYAHMLKNVQSYCTRFGIQRYAPKTHPTQIYQQPENGLLYFVEGSGLGSEFGFPRVQGKKKFRWKKMNFTTDLPKKNPQVTYIVASTTHTHTQQIDDNQQRLFRMHAVIPYHKQGQEPSNYILCHILQIKRKKEAQSIDSCYKQNKIDFYRLFSFMHNNFTQK